MTANLPSFFVQEASVKHLPAIQRLYLELAQPEQNAPVSQERAQSFMAELLRYPGSALLVGIADDLVVTTCTLVVIPNLTRQARPYAIIENVATGRDFRGRGYGTAILRDAVRRAFEAGCYKVMLMTGSKAPPTLRFYEKAGFEQTKTGSQIRAI